MPSTYSPDLRIELIANGEQTGAWGTTTNINLGTLIEDAISGAATVTITSLAQAFTAADGAADEARCAAIILDNSLGFLTTSFEVFAPPVTKLYILKNNTGYQATIYCSTLTGNTTPKGLGYIIPIGATVFIRSNGTEFSDAISRINGPLSLGTALTVPNGGTGIASIAAFSALVTNAANTISPLTVAAGQSIKLNGAGTAWEAFTPVSGGGGSVSFAGSAPAAAGQVTVYDDLTGTVIGTTRTYQFRGTTAGPAQLQLYEDTDFGTNSITIQPPTTDIGTSYTLTLPAAAPASSGRFLSATTAGVLSFVAPTGASAGTYGDSTNVAQITVTSDGRISSISNVAISGGGGGGDVVGPSSATNNAIVRFDSTTGKLIQNSVVTISDTGAATGFTTITSSSTITGNGFLTNSTAYNYTATSSTFLGSGVFSLDISANRAFNSSLSAFTPGSDNSITLGASGARWSVVWAATGTINTSDANAKQDIADLDDAEKRVATRIKGLFKKFRLKDAVAEKGDTARIHVGVIAQEVRDAFTAEGLDANRYALFCSDTWWEREEMVEYKHLEEPKLEVVKHNTPVEGATEVTRLGVRYEQLLAFVIAAM